MTRHMNPQVKRVKKSGVGNFLFFCLYTTVFVTIDKNIARAERQPSNHRELPLAKRIVGLMTILKQGKGTKVVAMANTPDNSVQGRLYCKLYPRKLVQVRIESGGIFCIALYLQHELSASHTKNQTKPIGGAAITYIIGKSKSCLQLFCRIQARRK